jgi:hypothetical protein
MTRHRAALTHLAISALIGLAALAGMMLLVYPPPFFKAARGHEMLMILLAVDVVVGPLCTWVIFKSGKRGLRFDLAVIGCLQAAALAYGLHIMYAARPVYVAFTYDRFDLVTAAEVDSTALGTAEVAEFRQLPRVGVKAIGIRRPRPDEQFQSVAAALSGADVQTQPKYHVPYAAVTQQVIARSEPVSKLAAHNRGNEAAVRRAVERTGLPEESLRFLPLRAPSFDLTVFVHAGTGAIADIADLRPW